MLSLAQAMTRRGASGVPLPRVYNSLPNICKGQLTLVIGPPSAGKSLFTMNLLAGMSIPSLAFFLDTTELTASARFAAILTQEDYLDIKSRIIDGDSRYHATLGERLPDVQAAFHAPGPEEVQLQLDAFEQRYGLPPDVVLLDNLGNQASSFDNEWAVSKALSLEYDSMARREQVAFIATAHTTDLDSAEPAQRTKLLGKISQYARLIFSVGYNDATGEFKIAVVKNSEGKSDVRAEHPVTLWADPARMQLTEQAPHPQLVYANQHRPAAPGQGFVQPASSWRNGWNGDS